MLRTVLLCKQKVRLIPRMECTDFERPELNETFGNSALSIVVELVEEFFLRVTSWWDVFNLSTIHRMCFCFVIICVCSEYFILFSAIYRCSGTTFSSSSRYLFPHGFDSVFNNSEAITLSSSMYSSSN